MDLSGAVPRQVWDTLNDGDLVVTVCDRAHELLAGRADLHWSVPDPVRTPGPAAFDTAFDELSDRVGHLARHLRTA